MQQKKPKNRLHLDFDLKTNVERANFLNTYLSKEPFISKPLTADESEICANYVLWGKDSETGLNSKQSKEIQLESRYGTWDARQDESLEGLLESPSFSETQILNSSTPPIKVQRQVFSRQEARTQAAPEILPQLEQLWVQIDELDLVLNFYDLAHGKRKTEPREELLKRISPARQLELKEKANKLNQFRYLKLRHLLVDLRREQFSYRDTYTNLIIPLNDGYAEPTSLPIIDSDICVFPIGLKYSDSLSKKIFPLKRNPAPEDFSETDLELISKLYWERHNCRNVAIFDFKELEHVYQFFMTFDDFQDSTVEQSSLQNSKEFLNTLNYYIERAHLNETQQTILTLKLRHLKNQSIADFVNSKFGKTYNANYISTIFRQKIIPQINEAAANHEEILLNVFFPENFKKCRTCGEVLLISTSNFTRKARSKDGFSHQCKRCDKAARERKKEIKQNE